MVFIEKILLMTITQHFKKRFGIPIIMKRFNNRKDISCISVWLDDKERF